MEGVTRTVGYSSFSDIGVLASLVESFRLVHSFLIYAQYHNPQPSLHQTSAKMWMLYRHFMSLPSGIWWERGTVAPAFLLWPTRGYVTQVRNLCSPPPILMPHSACR